MKKTLLSALIMVALSGCNSDSDSNSESANDSQDGSTDNIVEDFAEIEGLYAYEKFSEGDEGYLVIRSDGTLLDYDYAGDSRASEMGAHANCYHFKGEIATIERKTDSRFSLIKNGQSREEVEVTEEGLKLFMVFDDVVSDFYLLYPNTTQIMESDLAPLCEE